MKKLLNRGLFLFVLFILGVSSRSHARVVHDLVICEEGYSNQISKTVERLNQKIHANPVIEVSSGELSIVLGTVCASRIKSLTTSASGEENDWTAVCALVHSSCSSSTLISIRKAEQEEQMRKTAAAAASSAPAAAESSIPQAFSDATPAPGTSESGNLLDKSDQTAKKKKKKGILRF